MKDEEQRVRELMAYLKEAKEKQWTISQDDLMGRFDLGLDRVRNKRPDG